MKWIKLPDYTAGSLTVHEVKCPFCHNHETYFGNNVPATCYICEERMVDDEEA